MLTPWAFQQIQVACARGKFDVSLLRDGNEWYVEDKWDGDRRIGQGCDGKLRYTGRTKSKVDGLFVEKTDRVPHITSGLMPNGSKLIPDQKMQERIAALDGCVIDGECVLPDAAVEALAAELGGQLGALSAKVGSIMNSDPEKAIAKQFERGFLEWNVFDCLWFQGQDIRGLPLLDRKKHAAEIVKFLDNPYIRLGPSVNVGKAAFIERALSRLGAEGVIFKRADAAYGPDSVWVKNKIEKEYDVVIMGFEPPEQYSKKRDGTVSVTKYWQAGLIGRVAIGQYRDGKLWRCSAPKKGVSGFTDAMREDMTKNPDKYIGKVMEIRANAREPETGFFRHPRYRRIRDDKTAEECVYYENES